MKPTILKKWVKALRSGKYKQGRDRLRRDNGVSKFCCLGVLCDLYAKEKGIEWTGVNFLGESYHLPDQVIRWAGLKSNDPFIGEKAEDKYRASSLNDAGKRFKTIADLIVKAQRKKLI